MQALFTYFITFSTSFALIATWVKIDIVGIKLKQQVYMNNKKILCLFIFFFYLFVYLYFHVLFFFFFRFLLMFNYTNRYGYS